jgi:hypothetical protein
MRQAESAMEFDASGGDLGLQDGRRLLVQVVGWLRWVVVPVPAGLHSRISDQLEVG